MGEKARIRGFHPENFAYRQKLLSMGLIPHAILQVVRRAPMGDPIQIQIQNDHILLRKNEAQILQLERIV